MEEYRTTKVFPPPQDMFNAFEYTPLNDVKVVILGQDPYHNDGQANGLCFSVREDIDIPPSLVNIYKELHSDLGCYIPDNGCLEKWAKQGVFLLNTVLTVRWGRPAQMKKAMLNNPKQLVLTAAHPSPLSASRGFFGCRHFSQTNEFLEKNGLAPIDWQIENIKKEQ